MKNFKIETSVKRILADIIENYTSIEDIEAAIEEEIIREEIYEDFMNADIDDLEYYDEDDDECLTAAGKEKVAALAQEASTIIKKKVAAYKAALEAAKIALLS